MASTINRRTLQGFAKHYLAMRKMSSKSNEFQTLAVTRPKEFVVQVELNRPDRMNALNKIMWKEIRECFNQLAEDSDCRSVVLCGAGHHFCSGIDLADFADTFVSSEEKKLDSTRLAFKLRNFIQEYQQSFTAIEKCEKPVIAAIHNGCIGAGTSLITACDIRYCTSDSWYQIKEVELGLAADVGVLQRLPKIVGNDSLVRELAYTARRFTSDEAKEMGLVSRVFQDRQTLIIAALDLASLIASKSPVAVQGTKINLNYSRGRSVEEGLNYMANWNMSMLQSEDIMKATMANINKSGPATFSKL